MEKVMALRNIRYEPANPKINIKGMLYDNTYLCVSLVAKEKVNEQSGPLSVIENSIDGGLRFLKMTGLDIKASTIEEAFVREQAMLRRTT